VPGRWLSCGVRLWIGRWTCDYVEDKLGDDGLGSGRGALVIRPAVARSDGKGLLQPGGENDPLFLGLVGSSLFGSETGWVVEILADALISRVNERAFEDGVQRGFAARHRRWETRTAPA